MMSYEKEPLTVSHPELAAEWSEKNFPLRPDQVTYGSHDLVWWKGKCGHEWQAVVGNRVRGTSCPYCSSRKVLAGFNDLATKRPDLLADWDHEKNMPLKPDEIGPCSNRKVWWKCRNGHEYLMTPNLRSKGCGCKICSSGQGHLTGFNDLATLHPELAAEWSEKNLPLTPGKVFGLKKRQFFWWKCPDCGSEYKYDLRGRLEGYGCPYCAGFELKPGFNDLATTDPDITIEWDHNKNDGAVPEQFFRTSRRFAWWKCGRGHSYGCRINERTVGRKECYICEAEFSACLPGMLAIRYAKQNGLTVHVCYELEEGCSFEIYIPEIKLALETAGVSAEKQQKQKEKCRRCETYGFRCVIIERNTDRVKMAQAVIKTFGGAGIRITSVIEEDIRILREEFLGPPRRVSNAAKPFLEKHGKVHGYRSRKRESLSRTNPELIPQWSERNYPFTIDDENASSPDKVWWKGACGHEWKAMVRNRAGKKKTGCPYCSGHTVLKGFNDLASQHPELLKEWSDNNKLLRPDEILATSCKKVIWKCAMGHEWMTSPANRVKGNGCPICARDPLIRGVNDLATEHPELVPIWSEQNLPLKPGDIRAGYRKQVWWKCQRCGEEFQAQVKTEIYYMNRYGHALCRRCREKEGNADG
ncbi:MAG: zinc-ribbon domain-containing protein [Parasporobacterium sp.]|nr:zinc-ribbon domain-containing protein [Parasporobacterium sp.]